MLIDLAVGVGFCFSASSFTICHFWLLQIAGQRDLALALLSNVLNKALQYIYQNHVYITGQDANKVDRSIDWEAIWAYALGPEPELVLALR